MTYINSPFIKLLPNENAKAKAQMNGPSKTKTAGVIGGLGPQSTSHFYQAITAHCLEQELPSFPRLLINSVNTWAVTEIIKQKDLDRLLSFLKEEISLIQHQVDFLVMVCNSIHAVIEPIRKSLDIPVLAIHEEVCKEIAKTGIKKVGILGTKTTIGNNFYQQELAKFKIDATLLPPAQAAVFDTLIFEEILYGRGIGTMRRLMLEGIEYLRQQACEGIILACTELPLFVSQEDTDLPLFSSTDILAKTVVDNCFSNGPLLSSPAEGG